MNINIIKIDIYGLSLCEILQQPSEMQFTKGNKKVYCDKELQGNISNTFSFALKDFLKGKKLNEAPITCLKCKFPLTQKRCLMCDEVNQVQLEEGTKNIVYKESLEQENKLVESLILCIDLSGSMNISYPSTFEKINEDFVIRIIGKANFDFLKKRLGTDKVLKNYKIMEDLLNEGETPRNIVEMYKEDESRSQKSINATSQQNNEETEMGYISRKEIIQIGVSKYIEMIKARNPQTLITVVYFNNYIEIPVNNFNDKTIVPGLQNKSLEQIIQLGQFYADKISIQKAQAVGDKLVKNLTKVQANGQTALTPAITFCIGMAKKLKHCLHQIVVVTDGLSNIGFGQTQEEMQLEATTKLYEAIGLQYAKKYNCVFNIITFEDCVIGYDVIDQIVGITGGLPCQIVFESYKGQSIISDHTMMTLSFALVENFIGVMKQFGYKTKLAIKCSNPLIKLSIPSELKTFVTKNTGNQICFDLGIKSISYNFKIDFSLPQELQDGFEDLNLKFSAVCQYERGTKKRLLVNQQIIKVKKASKEEAEKEQSKVLEGMVKEKLQFRELFEEDVNSYKDIEKKLQNQNISKKVDEKMLEKFKLKKQKLEEIDHKMDKLAKEKMSMASRTYRTFQDKDNGDDDDDDDDGFK